MEILVLIIGVTGTILLAAYYSGMETACYSASRIRLQHFARQGNVRARKTITLLKNISKMITITLIGHNLSVYIGTYLVENYFSHIGWKFSEYWATFILTPFFFLFAEVIPKQIGHVSSEKFCMTGIKILNVSRIVYVPLAFILSIIVNILSWFLKKLNLTPGKITMREEFMAHIDFGTAYGLFNKTQHTVANNIMAIEKRPVNKIMTPFDELISAKKTSTCSEILSLMRDNRLKYIPIVNKNRQVVHGIVSLSNIIKNRINETEVADNFMENGVFIDKKSSIGIALSKLQQAKVKVGIVMDKEKAIGIVTIKSLIWNLIDKNIEKKV